MTVMNHIMHAMTLKRMLMDHGIEEIRSLILDDFDQDSLDGD